MGPLQGLKIIEIAGIGPAPFCGMLLADMGASIIRIERPGGGGGVAIPAEFNLLHRSRPAITVDLKSAAGVALVRRLCGHADALFEGLRPGVMEKFGLGPEDCLAINRRLVFGRMTGWGQDGPLAPVAGHDGNFAALAGALGAIGEKDRPPCVPLNLVADFGGGGVYLAMGIMAALLEAQRSGQGQVVDAAMVDGSASLMTLFFGLHAAGLWRDARGSNLLDGAAPFYRPYRTSDDEYVMVCAIEPQFFAVLLEVLHIDIDASTQYDQLSWPAHIAILEQAFASQTRAHWISAFEGTDACVSPVLSLAEAPRHPHNWARDTFVDIDGTVQPAPAPRFSRTPSEISRGPGAAEGDIRGVLVAWGLDDADIPAA